MTENNARHIYTVSKLTRQIKTLLEESYPFVWITGEISNYSVPGSGHSYFTLKDAQAVIQCVMFKNQKRGLKFNPENGLKVFGLARLSLYEPRGSYQLIFEHLEPEGAGSAQIAFEQLKTKLSQNGYFDPEHKKKIPFLPSMICVITSPTGAAVKDILNICQRRFPNCCIDIVPVSVQGQAAVADICNAFNFINERSESDVIILARGGGSLEDLAAFNSEPVAYAIFESKIPVITGIGHETDFTIADFVADLRAPTPSAAAELAIPDKNKLIYSLGQMEEALNRSIKKISNSYRKSVVDYTSRLKSPERIVYDFRFKLEDLRLRLQNSIQNHHYYMKEKHKWLNDSLSLQHPEIRIKRLKQQLDQLTTSLHLSFYTKMDGYKNLHSTLALQLDALNPEAVLQRGYSITRNIKNKTAITKADDVKIEDRIEIILHQGRLITKVEKTHGTQEKNI